MIWLQEDPASQRDGCFYAVSSKGFGVAKYGLPTCFRDWEQRPEYEKDRPEPPAREHSRGLDVRVSTPGRTRELIGDDPELKYVQPFVSDPDGIGTSIEGLAQAANEFRELPDNNMVYMLDHSSNYHSHKWGYGADGTDVAPSVGRVIPRENFFQLMNQCERGILAKIKARFEELGEGRTPETMSVYGNDCNPGCVWLPDAFVLTPYTFMSFIRRGEPQTDRDYKNNWTPNTHLFKGLTSHGQMDGYEESPFGFQVRVNSMGIFGKDAETLVREQEKITEAVASELKEAVVSAEQVAPTIQKLNDRHNTLFEENISWRRKQDRRRSA